MTETPTTTESFKRWMRESNTFKIGCIGFIALLLLIPVNLVEGLVSEREMARDKVVGEVSQKWGGAQTLVGPVLTIPVTVREKSGVNKNTGEVTYRTKTMYVHRLPEALQVDGNLTSKRRYRSIYEVLLYGSDLSFSGRFKQPEFEQFDSANTRVDWGRAHLSFGMSDLSGIRDEIQLSFAGNKKAFQAGLPNNQVLQSGVSVPVDLRGNAAVDTPRTYPFAFDVQLNGRETLHVVPAGKTTKLRLESDHPSPSFDGNFLPDSRSIDESGFTAEWSVLDLNRNFPQQWVGKAHNLHASAFGVKLVTPVDHYQKSKRSTKYGLLFIFLTFTVFFFAEFLNDSRIHPVQYLMVGAGICVFYVLLLALSEHIGFNTAFLAASIGIIGLITGYSKSILQDGVLTAIVGTSLVGLYAFLFTLLQLEMYALLIGSLGLFAILTVVMYLSRDVDWYRRGSRDGNV